MEGNARDIRLFTGNSNPALAQAIAKQLKTELGHVSVERFPDGEIFVQYKDNLRSADVFIIQSTSNPPNENLMELLIMLDAAKRASAARITAVIPFFPITAKLLANILTTAGADRILTMDLHADQIQGFFDIPVDHLLAAPVFIDYFRKMVEQDDFVIAASDIGGVKRAWYFAEKLNTPIAIVDKKRSGPESVEAMHIIGDVKGKNVIIPDDMLATGGTLVQAAKFLKAKGAKKIYACMTHGIFSGQAVEKINDSEILEVVVSNTIPQAEREKVKKIKVLSVGKLFGEAIKRIHDEQTISELFR